jgi:NAD(P)-dependent dehydrogenase (short-subunit alcohol dehydrogenase family)
MPEQFLKGRVAVVTGGRRGLGKAMALALGSAGARLALVDNESAADAVAEARALGYDAEGFVTNVADPSQVEALRKAVIERFGGAHILINAAGIVIRKMTKDLAVDEWNRLIGVNLSGAWYCCKAFLPHLKSEGYGRIINMCSVMAHVATADRVAYNASKAGLLAVTKSLALEVARDNVSVVAISPGAFATDMTAALRSDTKRNTELMESTPMARWGEPREIGELALFICSPGASYITGTDIIIDGGWLAGA